MGWTQGMEWINPPPVAEEAGGVLRVVTGDRQDFWRRTFYGFVHDDGHALLAETEGGFTAEVTFEADWQEQYDQAGLMLRTDESQWVKCGIEHVNGMAHLAVVVTLGRSDWSQVALPHLTGAVSLRLTRSGDAVWVQYLDGAEWKMVRLAHYPADLPAKVGPMTCSPSRAGLEVRFREFRLGPVADKPY